MNFSTSLEAVSFSRRTWQHEVSYDADFSETSVPTSKPTWCPNPEDSHLTDSYCESLKSCINPFVIHHPL